jgi:hypothetical protein
MKLVMGWVMSAGLVLTTATANAQIVAPTEIGRSAYTVVSDVGGPYAEAQEPRYVEPRYVEPRYSEPRYDGPRYGVSRYDVPRYGPPPLLQPTEVYTILRESGFSPLGIPQQRGFVYVISAIDRGGNDGRLVIDGRTGQIIRFRPAYRMGYNVNEDVTPTYGPAGPLPPMSNMRGVPRPPVSVPHVASRTPPVPLPKAPPPHTSEIKPEATPLAAKPAPEPAQQSAAVQDKPTEAPLPRPAAVPIVEAKPAPAIKPTQDMPKAQGLD